MIRFAVPPIGGKGWFGGWMYMCNLVRAMSLYGDSDIETVLFLGPDMAQDPYTAPLRDLPRTRVVIDPAFAEDRVRGGAGRALLTGRNVPVVDALAREGIDVMLTPAIYLGWRSGIADIAWFPDFQHRRLPHMFSRGAWWKRDLGFRAQVRTSTAIMLSSGDAERDCHAFYPGSRGKTRIARFAVPIDSWPDADSAWERLRGEGLPADYVFLPNQLWHHKNHELAIRAAALLAGRGSPRIILATGHGEDPRRPGHAAMLRSMVDEIGAARNFRFLGSVDHSLVKAMMVGATALLNPSRFEGWSTTVEEAKAVGTPMLLSDLPVHREQAPDATFFPPDDPDALATAIDRLESRSREDIAGAVAAAHAPAIERQRAFATAVSAIVREAARRGTPR